MSYKALDELYEPKLKQRWNDGQRNGAKAIVKTMKARGYDINEVSEIIMDTFNLNQSEAMQYINE